MERITIDELGLHIFDLIESNVILCRSLTNHY